MPYSRAAKDNEHGREDLGRGSVRFDPDQVVIGQKPPPQSSTLVKQTSSIAKAMPLRLSSLTPARSILNGSISGIKTNRCVFYSTPSSASTLKVTSVPAPHSGSIKILSLNRPKARNAISKQLLAELQREVDTIHAEPVGGPTRALILASESDAAFCAGADLKERLGFTQEEYAILRTSIMSFTIGVLSTTTEQINSSKVYVAPLHQ